MRKSAVHSSVIPSEAQRSRGISRSLLWAHKLLRRDVTPTVRSLACARDDIAL